MLESELYFYPEWYVSSAAALLVQIVPSMGKLVFVKLFGYRWVSKELCWNCGYQVQRQAENAVCPECGQRYSESLGSLQYFWRGIWMYLRLPAVRIGILLASVIVLYLAATKLPPSWKDFVEKWERAKVYLLVPVRRQSAYVLQDGSKYRFVTTEGQYEVSVVLSRKTANVVCVALYEDGHGLTERRALPVESECRNAQTGTASLSYRLPLSSQYPFIHVSASPNRPTASVWFPMGLISVERELPGYSDSLPNDQTPGGTN